MPKLSTLLWFAAVSVLAQAVFNRFDFKGIALGPVILGGAK